jgi:hypothetical protein
MLFKRDAAEVMNVALERHHVARQRRIAFCA